MLREIHRYENKNKKEDSFIRIMFSRRLDSKNKFYRERLKSREQRTTFDSLVEQELISMHEDYLETTNPRRIKKLKTNNFTMHYAKLTEKGYAEC